MRERREQRVLVAQQIVGTRIRGLQRGDAAGTVNRAPDTSAAASSNQLAQLPAADVAAAARSERDSAVGDD
jgi:hypothetical protein